jgi:hypothetical protein
MSAAIAVASGSLAVRELDLQAAGGLAASDAKLSVKASLAGKPVAVRARREGGKLGLRFAPGLIVREGQTLEIGVKSAL